MISYVYRRCVDATREGRLAFLNKAGAEGLEYVAGLAETSALGEGGWILFRQVESPKIPGPGVFVLLDGRVVADVPLHFEIGLQHRVSVSVSGPFGFDGAEFDVETSPGGEGGSVRAWTEDPHGHELRAVVGEMSTEDMRDGTACGSIARAIWDVVGTIPNATIEFHHGKVYVGGVSGERHHELQRAFAEGLRDARSIASAKARVMASIEHFVGAPYTTETRDAMVAGARSALDEFVRDHAPNVVRPLPMPIDDGTTFSIKEAWNRLSHHRQSEILALYVETTRASTTGMLFSEFFATLPEGRS